MSRRANQLNADFEAVKQKSLSDKGFTFKDLKKEDETIYFDYNNGNPKQVESFSLTTADYPDGYGMLFSSTDPDPKTKSGALQNILNGILKDLNAKYGIKTLRSSREAMKASKDGSEEEYDGSENSDDVMSTEEGEEWEEQYQTEVSYQDHKDLILEVQNYGNIFGKDNISTRPMPLLETVDIEANIVYEDILEHSVCSAWGIDPKLPLIAKLTFSALYFLEAGEEPKLEMYQNRVGKTSFGLKYQLEAICKHFIKDTWPKTSGKKFKTVEYVKKNIPVISNPSTTEEAKKGWFSSVFSNSEKLEKKNNKEKDKAEKGKPNVTKDADISSLVDMGFSIEMATNALNMTSSMDEALNLLLTDPESTLHVDPTYPTNNKSPSKKEIGNVNDLFEDHTKALRSSDKKVGAIPKNFGFMVAVACYLRERLPTLNDYCVICDQPHVFANGNMLKPAVCSRDLCVFSFQQLGVAGEFVDSIATGAEVVDLLVSFATIAAKSARRDVIFEPYPTIFDPNDNKRVILSEKSKNFDLLNNILGKFLSVEQMSKAKDFSDMKSKMDRAHQHSFPLLQWIISSNRSHIVKIHNEKQIKSMVTSHQYLLLSAPPEKEALFKSYKERHGSIFAFHGSSSENWHCILRVGLKNASGTKLQVNGAAYGNGIYLSPHAGTSFGYCRMNNYTNQVQSNSTNGNQFLNSENINCIAICEVINSEIRKHGSIWVQPNADYVVTRFFFVYTGANPGNAANCSTENNSFVQEIEKAIGYYY